MRALTSVEARLPEDRLWRLLPLPERSADELLLELFPITGEMCCCETIAYPGTVRGQMSFFTGEANLGDEVSPRTW